MTDKHAHHPPHHHPAPRRYKLSYWLLGIGSLVWLLLRSGPRLRRITYPCQRVAAANSVGFLTYLAALIGSAALLRRLKTAYSPARLLLLVGSLLLTASLQGSVATPAIPVLADSPDLPGWTSPTAVSDVFVVTNVPEPLYSLDGGVAPSDEPVVVAPVSRQIGAEKSAEVLRSRSYSTALPPGLAGLDQPIVVVPAPFRFRSETTPGAAQDWPSTGAQSAVFERPSPSASPVIKANVSRRPWP